MTTGVWGVLLQVEPGVNSGGARQTVEWYTKIGGMLVEINVHLDPQDYLVNVSVDTHSSRGKVVEVRNTTIAARGKFYLDQHIRWSPGSREYANKFTCYWLAIDDVSNGPGEAWKTICGIQ